MARSKNLWPQNLNELNAGLPTVELLNEQAAYLSKSTNNILLANTITENYVRPKLGDISNYRVINSKKNYQHGIVHKLNIVAPAMGNYNFELVFLFQESPDSYPLKVYSPLLEKEYDVADTESLTEVLGQIFQNKKTVDTIQHLVTLSKRKIDKVD